jgi:hypothetical protein
MSLPSEFPYSFNSVPIALGFAGGVAESLERASTLALVLQVNVEFLRAVIDIFYSKTHRAKVLLCLVRAK